MIYQLAVIVALISGLISAIPSGCNKVGYQRVVKREVVWGLLCGIYEWSVVRAASSVLL